MKKNIFSLLCLCAILIFAGCSSSRPSLRETASQRESSEQNRHSLAEYEATMNPAEFDREVDVVEKAVEEKKIQTPIEIPRDSTILQEEVVQGFRIQVFSSSGVDEAAVMKTVAMKKFAEDSVYIVYDAPVYKIRVGDFVNRYEANQRLPEFVEKGYRDAWIVPDRIIQRKSVRVPLLK